MMSGYADVVVIRHPEPGAVAVSTHTFMRGVMHQHTSASVVFSPLLLSYPDWHYLISFLHHNKESFFILSKIYGMDDKMTIIYSSFLFKDKPASSSFHY